MHAPSNVYVSASNRAEIGIRAAEIGDGADLKANILASAGNVTVIASNIESGIRASTVADASTVSSTIAAIGGTVDVMASVSVNLGIRDYVQ